MSKQRLLRYDSRRRPHPSVRIAPTQKIEKPFVGPAGKLPDVPELLSRDEGSRIEMLTRLQQLRGNQFVSSYLHSSDGEVHGADIQRQTEKEEEQIETMPTGSVKAPYSVKEKPDTVKMEGEVETIDSDKVKDDNTITNQTIKPELVTQTTPEILVSSKPTKEQTVKFPKNPEVETVKIEKPTEEAPETSGQFSSLAEQTEQQSVSIKPEAENAVIGEQAILPSSKPGEATTMKPLENAVESIPSPEKKELKEKIAQKDPSAEEWLKDLF